jgi:hypothetical protein
MTNEPKTTGRRYCFTVFNPNGEDWPNDPVFEPPIRYLLYGREICPTTNKKHLQGYLELESPRRITTIKKIPGFETAHFTTCKGTFEENYRYCTKEGQFKEQGTHSSQGKRTDYESALEIIRTAPNRTGLKRVMEEAPDVFFKYPRGLEKAIELCIPPPTNPPTCVLQPWQHDLYLYLVENPPAPRLIKFFVDEKGGCGKSWFVRYFYCDQLLDTLVLSNGKHDRLYHCYSGQKYVLFDFTRSTDPENDHLPYAVIENIKNGYKPPGMYGTAPQFYDIPHVIVFTNQFPNMKALSDDRYDITNLATPTLPW